MKQIVPSATRLHFFVGYTFCFVVDPIVVVVIDLVVVVVLKVVVVVVRVVVREVVFLKVVHLTK